jgi:hypothetical protein
MKGEDSKIKAISIDEAIKLGEGQPDSASLDSYWTEAQLDELFVKP